MPNMFFAIQWATEAVEAARKRSCGLKPQKGVITMEYGLIGVLIAIAMIGSFQAIRDKVFNMLTTIINAFP